jgi:hypothetical protein
LILQQLEICTRKITVIGPVDPDAGGENDPLIPDPEQPVVITDAGRCYDGSTLLLVPASCLSDDECPVGATCEDEPIVATFRETTSRDVVLKPAKPLKVKIGEGDSTVATTFKVKIVSADPRGSQAIPIRLTAADGDCPPGTVDGLPDLDGQTGGVQDTVLLAGAKTVKAEIPLVVAASAFATHNGKAPARCRLELTASIPLVDNEDPTPANNRMTVELNITDANDTPQESPPHESVVTSVKPLGLKIGSAGSAMKSVKVSVVNADYLPSAEASHDIAVSVDQGDCPAGTLGAPLPATATVGGGAKATIVVPVTATAAAFTTTNKKSPARCIAVITATTEVMGNVEPNAANNVTHLVIDVVDKTD